MGMNGVAGADTAVKNDRFQLLEQLRTQLDNPAVQQELVEQVKAGKAILGNSAEDKKISDFVVKTETQGNPQFERFVELNVADSVKKNIAHSDLDGNMTVSTQRLGTMVQEFDTIIKNSAPVQTTAPQDYDAARKVKSLDSEIRSTNVDIINKLIDSPAVQEFMDWKTPEDKTEFVKNIPELTDRQVQFYAEKFDKYSTETAEQKAARQPDPRAVEALQNVDAIMREDAPAAAAPAAKPFGDEVKSPLMADVSVDRQKAELLAQIEQKLQDPLVLEALKVEAKAQLDRRAMKDGVRENSEVADFSVKQVPVLMKLLETRPIEELRITNKNIDNVINGRPLEQQAPAVASVENTAPAQSAVTPSANEIPVVAEKVPAPEIPKLMETWNAVALPPILENTVAPQQAPEASVTPVETAPAESVVDAKPAEVVSNVYEGVIARDGAEPVPAVAVAQPSELVIGDVPAAGVTLISAKTEVVQADTPQVASVEPVAASPVEGNATPAAQILQTQAPQMSPVLQPKLAVFDTSAPAANEAMCVAGPEAANDEVYTFSQKEAVGEIQTFLIARGHEEVANAVGTPTTVFGRKTAAALNAELRNFQESQNLDVNGKYNAETRAALDTHIQKLEESDSSLAGTYALLRDGLNAMQDNVPKDQPNGAQNNALDIVYNKGSIEPPAPVKAEPCAPVTIVDNTSRYTIPKAS